MTFAHSRSMSPSDRAGKPGFSPDTSVFSVLETFVIIALYKSTFTIPYHNDALSTDLDDGVSSAGALRLGGRVGERRRQAAGTSGVAARGRPVVEQGHVDHAARRHLHRHSISWRR